MEQCTLSTLPSWVQAFAAIGIVCLTLLTLIVLKGYADDTKTIANASVSQLEHSQMPFLAVRQEPNVPNQVGGWVLENQGYGPAINVSYHYQHHGEIIRQVPPLAPGTKHGIHNDFAEAIGNPLGFEIQYESLSGLQYHTTVTWNEAGAMRTRFQHPEMQRT